MALSFLPVSLLRNLAPWETSRESSSFCGLSVLVPVCWVIRRAWSLGIVPEHLSALIEATIHSDKFEFAFRVKISESLKNHASDSVSPRCNTISLMMRSTKGM